MTQTQNGLTAGNSQPVKNTFKQGHHFTLNQLKNQPVHHHAGATLRPSPKGMVHKNTLKSAVHSPTESGVLLCPEFNTAAHCRINGCGLGAMVRKAIGVTGFTFLTPSPPDARKNASSGFSVQPGTGTMKPTTTGASAQTTPTPHDHTALVLRAQNHLALALFELRNNTGTTPTRKAMGLAYAAGRALSQAVGGAV